MRKILAYIAAGILMASCGSVRAAEDFAGKTINIIVGFSPGGGYDIYSRVIARHLPNAAPGRPNVVVQNMPGAGSAKAASYIHNVAPADGTAIGAVAPGAIIQPLLDPGSNLGFDPTKFSYIGSADILTLTCVTMKTAKVQSFADAQKEKTTIGAVSAGSSTYDYAWLHKKTANAKFEIVSGYPGTSEIALAMDRGEVDGACGLDWASLKTLRPNWLTEKKVNVIVRVGPRPDPDLLALNVPDISAFFASEKSRKVAELVAAQQVFGRPYILPPKTPSEKVVALRSAFAAVLANPEFLKEADKLGLSIKPATGPSVEEAVKSMFDAPQDVIEAARQAIKQ